MNDLMVLFAQYWWVGLIVLVLGWGIPHVYWEIERRRNPVKAQFVMVTLGCLMVIYYSAGILTFFLTILACLKHLFFR